MLETATFSMFTFEFFFNTSEDDLEEVDKMTSTPLRSTKIAKISASLFLNFKWTNACFQGNLKAVLEFLTTVYFKDCPCFLALWTKGLETVHPCGTFFPELPKKNLWFFERSEQEAAALRRVSLEPEEVYIFGQQ